mgnify:CR=1 FL=1
MSQPSPWIPVGHYVKKNDVAAGEASADKTVDFEGSVGKAQKAVAEMIERGENPFPELQNFFVFSKKQKRWCVFRRRKVGKPQVAPS